MHRISDSTLSEWQRNAEELRLLIELGGDEQWIATVDEVILAAAALGTWTGGLDKNGSLLRQLEASQDAFEAF